LVTSVRPYELSRPSSSFFVRGKRWTLRFSTGTVSGERTHRAPTMILGCTPETHRRASDLFFAGRDWAALRGSLPGWPLAEASCELEITPLMRSGTPLVTSLLESGRPGDSTPQHLPPMGFLNPATVCSSEQRACLVSYRHHLWGSKSESGPTGFHGASWAGQLRRAIPTFVAPRQDDSSHRSHSAGHVPCFTATPGTSIELSFLGFLPIDHSPTSLRTETWGGGSADGPEERVLNLDDAPCVVAVTRNTPVAQPAMQRSLTRLRAVDFFCALASNRACDGSREPRLTPMCSTSP
jgi:hypothetical protein